MSYGILLDSGAVLTLPAARTMPQAVATLRRWKQARKDALARNDIVSPRLALGLVTMTARKRGGRAARMLGSKGGLARAAALSPARRSEIARGAAEARWSK